MCECKQVVNTRGRYVDSLSMGVIAGGSKVISFRVPDDLYDEFERKCKDGEVSLTVKLREFVDDLFRRVAFSDHIRPLSSARTNIIPGLVFGRAGLSLNTNYTPRGTHHQNWHAGSPENPVGDASPNPTAYSGAAMSGDNNKVNLMTICVID